MKYKQIDVPYHLEPCLPEWKRHRYMLTCMEKKYPAMVQQPYRKDEKLSLVAYGPSLKDTWQDIKHPMMTMSGAHNFMVSKGVIPDYHCDVDPRPHKVDMLTPHEGVCYMMASVCHPLMWEKLKGFEVIMWHVVSGKDTLRFLEKFAPWSTLVSGWSCVGLTAIHLGGLMGYDHFDMYGYDGSWWDDDRTAGEHRGMKHGKIPVEHKGRVFFTSKMMANANAELQYLLTHYPIDCTFHGDGYNQWWVKKAELPHLRAA
jgi:hypothetical protein